MKFLSLLVNVAQWSPMNARLQGASAENLLEEGISYKKQRYKNFSNKIHNSRAKKATCEKGKRATTARVIKQKKA